MSLGEMGPSTGLSFVESDPRVMANKATRVE